MVYRGPRLGTSIVPRTSVFQGSSSLRWQIVGYSGASPPYGVVKRAQSVLAVFHVCTGNGVAKISWLRVEPVCDRWTFPLVAQVLKLEWDKAASYPACQV